MTLPFDYLSTYGYPQGSFAPTTRKAQLDDILNSLRNGALRANTNWNAPQSYTPPASQPSSVADLVKAMFGGGSQTNPSTPTPAAPALGTAAAPSVTPGGIGSDQSSTPWQTAPAPKPFTPAMTAPTPAPLNLYNGPGSSKFGASQQAPGAPDFNAGAFGGGQPQGGQSSQGLIPRFINDFKSFMPSSGPSMVVGGAGSMAVPTFGSGGIGGFLGGLFA